jgi:hypothetical protein
MNANEWIPQYGRQTHVIKQKGRAPWKRMHENAKPVEQAMPQ